MTTKNLQQQLDHAIDNMDTKQIFELLNQLEEQTIVPVTTPNSKLFAKRIIKEKNTQSKGYDSIMKLNKKRNAIIASIALVLVTSTSLLYATGILNKLIIFRDDATYTISSTTPLTEEEANALIEDSKKTETSDEEALVTDVQSFTRTYNTLEEAAKDLDVPLVIPTVLPSEFTLSKDVDIETFEVTPGHVSTHVYLNFTNPTIDPTLDIKDQKLFQISVLKDDYTDVEQAISKTDAVYSDTYTNALNDTFTIFNEEGAIIAQQIIGDITYNLCFYNISEEEIHNILDHTDLTIYKN